MAWPELSIEDFPPHRDDEPSSLRQDIIDELSDHFMCALNRELLKNPDEGLAQERVLDQFGDPIKIARQLWLDEMKEKIMSQRILTGVSVAMAICGFIVVGLVWTMMQESRAFNLQLLEQFKESQNRSDSDTAGALRSISFQLVQNNAEEKPSENFSGTLSKIENQNIVFAIDAKSDKNGLLDFGKLPWGTYSIHLVSPWNEICSQFNITTLPGRAFEQKIHCPSRAPENVPVRFEVDWADQPADQENLILCDFRYRNSYTSYLVMNRKIQQYIWSNQEDLGKRADHGVYLIDVKKNLVALCPLAKDGGYESTKYEDLDWESTVNFLQGDYLYPAIYLVQKDKLAKLDELNSIKRISVISKFRGQVALQELSLPYQNTIITPFSSIKVAPGQLAELKLRPLLITKEGPVNPDNIQGVQYGQDFGSHLKARKDERNVWTITIPDLNPLTLESSSLNSTEL